MLLLALALTLLPPARSFGGSLAGSLAAPLAAPLAPPADDDVRAWLARLRADSAAERARAQRWLSRHLADGDLDLVRGAATAGDAEVRQRLVAALADDDRLVSIAAQLAASSDVPAAQVGRSALQESIARWSPGWTETGLARDDTFAKLSKLSALRDAPPVAVDPRASSLRLDLALEDLARLLPGAPQLVLDPAWTPAKAPRDRAPDRPAAPGTASEGTFEHVLGELLDLHRVDCEGFDFPDADDGPSRPWIRIGRDSKAPRRSAAEQVSSWCEGFLRAQEPARRVGCARAIAASGWPAGISWLERRWRADADEAALDGVLLAAGRGLVVPSLAQVDVQRDLYRSLHAAATTDPPDFARADAIARAIGAAGPRGRDGEDLAALALVDLPKLPPREQWLRLVAVEAMPSSSADAARAIDALFAAPDALPAVQFQALRARAAARAGSSAPPAVRDARMILAWADSTGHLDECARLLAGLGVVPPKPGDSRAGGARGPARSLAELEWTLAAGDASTAAKSLLELAAPVERGGVGLEALAARTRRGVLRGSGARLQAAVAAARALPGADPARLDRLEVLSGSASADVRARLLASVSAPRTREDLLCLGALAAGPGSGEARKSLVLAVTAYSPLDDVVAALDLALQLLRADRDDLAERDLVQTVRRVSKDGPPDLRMRFLVGTWPGPGGPDVARGRDIDRSLASSGLP